MKSSVIVFPGSNCDRDVAVALEKFHIKNVRQGKYFEIELDENDKKKAEKIIEKICKRLLTNTVIEEYKIYYK